MSVDWESNNDYLLLFLCFLHGTLFHCGLAFLRRRNRSVIPNCIIVIYIIIIPITNNNYYSNYSIISNFVDCLVTQNYVAKRGHVTEYYPKILPDIDHGTFCFLHGILCHCEVVYLRRKN